MTRLKSKSLRGILALALTLALCLGMGATTVFGAPYDSGTYGDDAEAALTKTLQMPEGTTTPTATFTFEFTKVDLDGDTTAAAKADMPAVNDLSLNFTAADTGTVASGIKTVMKETGSIFTPTNMNSVYWPRAGVYHYTVAEKSGTYTLGSGETLTYSPGVYNIFVWVDNDPSGLYVKFIETIVSTPDIPSIPGGTKVPGTPGTQGQPGTYSKMVFTNTFTKSGNPNPANTALAISKVVTGNFANQNHYFDYTLDLTAASLIPTPPHTYKVYILDNTNANVIAGATEATAHGITIAGSDTYGNYFTVATGTQATFKLKHNEHIAFGAIDYGVKYTVNEAGHADWTPSVGVTIGGVGPASSSAGQGQPLATGPNLVTDTGANLAAYSNAYKSLTPTGLDINDLPFITMLVLAAGAVVAFVAVKYRKKAKASNR